MQKQLIQADQLASQLLLGSKWAPVTNTLSFINAPLEEAAKVWHEWNQSKAQNKDDALMIEATGTLEEQFARLVPLDSGGRHLFLETKNPEWTAAVNNSVSGPDLSSMLYFRYSQARGIRSVTVTEIPHSVDKKSYPEYRGRYGVRKIMVMGSEEFASYVSLVNDDRWVFDRDGTAFADFEDKEAYKSVRATDRFTHDMLVRYCQNLGLDPFNEDFYVPNGRGILVDFNNHSKNKTFTLAEARAGRENRDIPPVGR
ncbi:hypothetical protein V3C41_07420 [Paenarthrobacter nicotinovorans]|uniref:Uncharacterized protein n=2 Tax=Micrococcaceae TaxID=1268 RepID=A0ABV0GQQ7_PAENI|nr:hypothetical protein [Paenarthrobacter nicotinovorans]BCW56734.1 hypothetical protein StoSoilB20_00810 [Arthrobacter sp. StoSoilB20]